MEHLQQFLDLHKMDIDPEIFAAALAVQHIGRLIAHGGSELSGSNLDSALLPEHLEAFLSRAVEMAKKTRRFEQEWRRLQRVVPRMKIAWEKGQNLFQEALARATSNEEEMESLSQIDAVDSYIYVSARNIYPDDPALQAWLINGYMVAWRRHFLEDGEREEKQGESTNDRMLS